MSNYKDLIVYQKAFKTAMKIFEISQQFPKEEKYSLTDQIRRSSRSVCSNIAEGYRKRMYPAHFVSKISDADMENAETQTWLDFSLACMYMTQEVHYEIYSETEETGKLLHHIIEHAEKYCIIKNQK